ncbi:MAG: UDP-N-acetyl-alpha-D-glucosamine C6 dehydratase [Turneriella sp.]|nr:UDP-N-acetyl-alpha-D-glucosamine C6 dehydratase [Turneriella sp.]
MLKTRLLNLSFTTKRLLQVAADIVLVWLSLWLAFVLRVGWQPSIEAMQVHLWLFIVTPVVVVSVFIPIGMYRAVIRHLGREAFTSIAKAVTFSALLLALLIYWYQGSRFNLATGASNIPRSFILNYWMLSFVTMGGLRLFMRYYFVGDWQTLGVNLMPFMSKYAHLPKVAIYGAGSAGNQLVTALRMGKLMHPVAFIDDDIKLQRRTIAGLRVYPPTQIERLIADTEITQVLLALPSVGRSRRREIITSLEAYPLHVRTIPGFMDLASGRIAVQDIQEVDIGDLLGRDPVAPHKELFEKCIKEQIVMVTGAGGSIGSELCRQILVNSPTALVLYEHSEFNLYSVHQELVRRIERAALPVKIVPILGSIRNTKRLREVMEIYKVNTVYHAAAYKHVPLVEHNIVEGVVNNTLGTLYTAQAAIAAQVRNFVLVSTDKAVRPTNIMGATKRVAELVLQAMAQEKDIALFNKDTTVRYPNRTRFTMVRFGNVLGSSGSVIPLFREQIQNGGPVTVTHPNITRYFMTIPEAAELVIQAGSMGKGGDVFVLDMGDPIRIVDLARKMILLTGLTVRSEENPKGDIAIEFTGLRPGEKLYEELLIGENVESTEHPKIMRANEKMHAWGKLEEYLLHFKQLTEQENTIQLRQLLREVVEDFNPQNDIVDLVYHEKRTG